MDVRLLLCLTPDLLLILHELVIFEVLQYGVLPRLGDDQSVRLVRATLASGLGPFQIMRN